MNYDIIIASYSFRCPYTGIWIKRGENCVRIDGNYISLEALNILEEDELPG